MSKNFPCLWERVADIHYHTAAKQVLNCTVSDPGILALMESNVDDPLIKELKGKYG